MARKHLKVFITVMMMFTMLVGCGGKETVTDSGTETNVVESEVSTQEETQEATEVAKNETETETTPTPEPTETPTPTPEPTETPTPTPEPTETPTPTTEPTQTPTQEVVHEHSYTETIIVEALCNTTGTKRYTCSCGHSYDESYIDTWNHRSDGNRIVITQPSCGEAGYGNSAETCINCGQYINGISIPPVEHVPDNYWVYFTEGAAAKLGINAGYYLSCANCAYTIEYTITQPAGEIKTVEEWEVY